MHCSLCKHMLLACIAGATCTCMSAGSSCATVVVSKLAEGSGVYFPMQNALLPLCLQGLMHVCSRACRFEAWIPIVGAIVTIIVFVALPTYFYMHNFPYLDNCGADVTRYY